jgi:hypothetical protein
MMWACTCGLLHPLATMTRCDDGVPTSSAVELLVDILDALDVEELPGVAL